MELKKILESFLCVMVVVGGCFLGGCGKEPEVSTVPVYGVVDTEAIVRAHPTYSKYFRLESEYKALLVQYEQQQKKVLHLASVEKHLKDNTQLQMLEKAAETEWKAKVKTKESEFNERLRARAQEISHRHEGKHSTIKTTEEDRIRMANLHLKLMVLGVSGEEKERIEGELRELLHAGVIVQEEQMGDWTKDEIKEFLSLKDQYRTDLNKYAEETMKEIREKTRVAQKSYILSEKDALDEANAKWSASWKQKLDLKQKEMAKVKEQIMNDVRRVAASVAEAHHVEMIFSKYKVNVKAVDMTDEIVTRIVNVES